MWIRRVLSFDSSKFAELLLSLSPEDRRFRFTGMVRDEIVQRYVDDMKWRSLCVYGMFDRDGALLGAVELVPTKSGTELAIEVRSTHQGQGIGSALMHRAMVHAKVRGLKKLQILCASDNAAMQRLARGVGMDLTHEYGEVEGRLLVGPATTADYVSASWCQVDATVGSSLAWAGDTLKHYQEALHTYRPF
jgi:RimJ/RimL family protein N-acetyltransferase